MDSIQAWAGVIALIAVVAILGSTVLSIWAQSPSTEDFLSLTELVLSWPVAAGGLVFGGGQGLIAAYKKTSEDPKKP